jgi:hypothetical protein
LTCSGRSQSEHARAGAGGSGGSVAHGGGGLGAQAGSSVFPSGGAGVAGSAGSVSGGAGEGAASGTSGAAGESGAPNAEPDISGDWAMFGFEDPVAVSLVQHENVLTGYGCCAGLGETGNCCGPIKDGWIAEGRAHFAFAVTDFDDYVADVVVSSDAARMAGEFEGLGDSTTTTAWTRISSGDIWLTHDDASLRDAVEARVAGYALKLGEVDGDEFSSDRSYEVVLAMYGTLPLLYGDFGPYWAGEMTWQADQETLAIGPVPTTLSTLPTALAFRFSDTLLVSVEATMPSGNDYVFDVSPP